MIEYFFYVLLLALEIVAVFLAPNLFSAMLVVGAMVITISLLVRKYEELEL